MKLIARHLPASSRQLARLALLLVVLGALGVQQWAVHSHWHAAVADAADAGAGVPVDDSGERGLPGHDDCLWCQSAAHAASAAPPAAWSGFIAPDLHVFTRHVAGFHCDFPAPPAWAWQSRGPPAA